MAKHPFALQLYTVRDHLKTNVADTLTQVKKIGYDCVELSGLWGLTPSEFRKRIREAGLKGIGIHVSYEDVTVNVASVIEMAHTLDMKYVSVASIDPKYTPDKQGWIRCGKALDAGGAALRQAGIRLCFHNHSQEFQWLEGDLIYDLLLGNADTENLAAEIDTFWVRYAGFKPADVIAKYSGRCPLLHVKDMLDSKSRAFSEMGEGIFKWDEIFKVAEQAGVQWYIVEQDSCARDSLESARLSAGFMAQH